MIIRAMVAVFRDIHRGEKSGIFQGSGVGYWGGHCVRVAGGVGVLGCWSVGVLECWGVGVLVEIPHFSTSPLLHFSTSPLLLNYLAIPKPNFSKMFLAAALVRYWVKVLAACGFLLAFITAMG